MDHRLRPCNRSNALIPKLHKMNTATDMMVITPCAGCVILHGLSYGCFVEIRWQEHYPEPEREKAKQWLLAEGFCGLLTGQVALDPEVTAYLETI